MKLNLYKPHTIIPPEPNLTQLEYIKWFCTPYTITLNYILSKKEWEIFLNNNSFNSFNSNYFYIKFNDKTIKIYINYPFTKNIIDDYLITIYYRNYIINKYEKFNFLKFLGYSEYTYIVDYIDPYIYKVIVSKINNIKL